MLQVVSGSPADRAGIKPAQSNGGRRVTLGDVIVAIDGKPVKSSNELVSVLDKHEFGDKVTFSAAPRPREPRRRLTLSGDSRGEL